MPCKDGYVVVVTPEEHQWKDFMKLLGNPEWSKEEWCSERATRADHVEEIEKDILEWMKDRPKEEIFRNGQAMSVPIAPANSPQDIVESPQFNARNFFVEMEHPGVGKIEKFPSSPYRFSKTPWKIERPAPLLGEHNEKIYFERLGYTREDFVRFKELEII